MISWIVENKDLLFFGQSMFALAAIYHVGRGRSSNGRKGSRPNERRPRSGNETLDGSGNETLDVESVFNQLRETPKRQLGNVSHGYIGTRVRATGSLCGVRKLTDDMMSISVMPRGVEGSVSVGVPFAEYKEMVASEQELTLEGEIEFMDLEHTHELYLSHADVSVAA